VDAVAAAVDDGAAGCGAAPAPYRGCPQPPDRSFFLRAGDAQGGAAVQCPYCDADDDRVVDSRAAEAGAAIRRRRECLACGQRFSTYERVEQPHLTVAKRDGSAEPFDAAKVQAGIAKATKNLAVTPDGVRLATARVEARVRALGRRQVDSDAIGAEVLAALRDLDHVAYVRFASVYKGFTTPEDFVRELADLAGEPPPRTET
jgi:transcriptional repressor NrdR